MYGEEVRFVFWDVIRYDGFIRDVDDRMGYNWRYNGLNHMMMLAMQKNSILLQCYTCRNGRQPKKQLDATIEKYNNKCVVKQLDGIWRHDDTDSQEIIIL